jgi:hypothetical protein
MAATLVLVMAKAEVAKKQAADQADWDKRGVSGEVTAVAADSITLKVRGKPLVIALAKDAGSPPLCAGFSEVRRCEGFDTRRS